MTRKARLFYIANTTVALATAVALCSIGGLKNLIDSFSFVFILVAALLLIGARAAMLAHFPQATKIPLWLCFYLPAAALGIYFIAIGAPWFFLLLTSLYAALMCMALVPIFTRRLPTLAN